MKANAAESLPSKNGVSPSCVALPPGEWPGLIDFLEYRFPVIGRAEWLARMGRGEVLNAEGMPLLPDSAYCARAKIFYYRSVQAEERIPFDERVLYQDDHLVAVDKPHFLPVVPAGRYLQETLLVRMKRRLGIQTLSPVHRIDRETAGIVLFCTRAEMRDPYQRLFRQRTVAKCYEAIAPLRASLASSIAFPITYRSRLEEGASFMQMREVPGEPNAETRIELQETRHGLARFHLYPLTGQKHQLRAHMAALGMPILNDRIYPVLLPEEKMAEEIALQYGTPLQLLAKSLSFIDPVSGKTHYFESRFTLQW